MKIKRDVLLLFLLSAVLGITAALVNVDALTFAAGLAGGYGISKWTDTMDENKQA